MPRVRIPYDALIDAARKKYPYPVFRNVTVERRDRYNNIPSPTVVYDRSGGNYAKMGFLCTVVLEEFDGLEVSQSQWRPIGYEVVYTKRRFKDVLTPE